MARDLKSQTIQIMDIFFNQHDAEKLKDLLSEGYIQHNPMVPTGRSTILNWMLPILQKDNSNMANIRIFQDGNYVVTHNLFDNAETFGGKEILTFDVWGFDDNGILNEHWDSITLKGGANLSGHTQVDGTVETGDPALTAQHKNIVDRFVREFFIGRDVSKLATYVASDLIQHGTDLSDGAPSMISRLSIDRYDRLHKILGEGDMVLAVIEGTSNETPTAFYNLFRLAGEKIVEQWSIYQAIPSEQAHDNTMFNFK